MSKKMWHNIFKSKSQKAQLKLNRRHSRGFYEEYQQQQQQQSKLPNCEKSKGVSNENDNISAYGSGNGDVNGSRNGNGNENKNKNANNEQINVFEQQPLQSSFNSATLNEAQQLHAQQTLQHQQQQQHQHLSTFSRVRNTLFSKKRVRCAKSINMEPSGTDDNQNNEDEELPPAPGPLTSGMPIPIPEHPPSSSELTPCPNCSRTFNVNALRKHIVVCEKMSKKRKVFDSSRQRREGTSLSTYVLPKNFGLPNAEKAAGLHTPPLGVSRESTTVVPASKQQAREDGPSTSAAAKAKKPGLTRTTARASMRNAAGASQAAECAPEEPTAAAAAPSTVNRERKRSSDRSLARRIKEVASNRCPHCDRSFNPKAFDRHVEWCKEKAIQNSIKSANTTETTKAKERMEARKQYRPPNLKTKRSINRDKYSGTPEEQQYEEEMLAQKQQYNPNQSQMTLSSMTSSVHSDNSQRKRPGTPKPKTEAAVLAQSTYNLAMEAEAVSNSTSKLDQIHRSIGSARRKQQVDGIVERLRRTATSDSLQIAKLECKDAPLLQPLKPKRAVAPRQKSVSDVSEHCLPTPRAAMTFEELNGLFKQSPRQAGTNVCNIKMDMPEADELSPMTKMRSSTSIVRQARRRIRTRENPSIDLHSLTPSPVGDEVIKVEEPRSSRLLKKQPIYLPQIEPNPVSEVQRTLSHKQRSQTPIDDYIEDDEVEEDLQEEYDDADLEVSQLLESAELINEDSDEFLDTIEYEDEQLKQAPPKMSQQKQPRCLVAPAKLEEGTMYIKAPPSPVQRQPATPQLVNSGLGSFSSEKYDPFLSAKRQLEELCSPNTPPDNKLDQPTTTPSTFMSSSLTTALEAQHNKPATPSTGSQSKAMTTSTSNFRRTASLRGPRRSPLLPSRPLFVTNYRPTIQRGLSDEGPISSSFLKPEEYDEMPVRSVCSNDFHSPLVVRRDTSASNRKQQQQLKLPVGGTKPTQTRQVANTDSLAVFLKYEHELEQPSNAEVPTVGSKELNSKELKDKSNILSKQNSAKNLVAMTGNTPLLPPLTTTATPVVANENVNNNNVMAGPPRLAPIRLESIFGSNQLDGRDYIDPNLINPCDNLHVHQSSSPSCSSNASSTPQQQQQQQKSSQNRESSESIMTLFQEQPKQQRRNSGISLKRKMRLGRNQFLYDASPEDQEQLPEPMQHPKQDDEPRRLSLKSDEQCWQQQQKLLSMTPPTMPTLPVLPPFDDFDFDEFLSSFENDNDDGDFPLFRDCREFLMNRATNRHRSLLKMTSTPLTPLSSHSQMGMQMGMGVKPTATLRPATTGNASSQLLSSLSTKESHAHRSDSNVSSSGGSFKQPSSGNGSYMSPQTSGSSYKTPPTSGDEKLQQQQQQQYQQQQQQLQQQQHRKPLEDAQKREIFISIETEANAQGRSPISPDTLRNMVGNMQTPLDVVHIENGNEPEHGMFSKILDTDQDHLVDAELVDEASHNMIYKKRLTPTANPAATYPDVEANNEKNANEKKRNEMKRQQARQGQQNSKQDELKASSPSGDSDELSSLDGYPMSSSYSSRRGAGAKLSSDSAYGSNTPYSLSRQRSDELQQLNNSQRGQNQLDLLGCTKMDASTQAQSKYGSLKARQRLFPGPGEGCIEQSSSDSEQNQQQQLQQQQQQQGNNYNNNNFIQQQQQQQSKHNNNNNYEQHTKNIISNSNSINHNNHSNNNIVGITPTTSQHSLLSNTSNASSGMSASSKMSKFCHECGGKFILEHAKFCMECGVRRVVL